MSISMNNHETRIKALESKSNSIVSITELSLSENGWARFSNGLQFNWGWKPNVGNVTYPKPFSNNTLNVVVSPGNSQNSNLRDLYITGKSKTGFTVYYTNNTYARYFAIGY